MNQCFHIGMSGNCGPDCPVFLDGECEVGNEIIEQMCNVEECDQCMSWELNNVYDFKCKLSPEIRALKEKIIETEYSFNRDFTYSMREIKKGKQYKTQVGTVDDEKIDCDKVLIDLKDIVGFN